MGPATRKIAADLIVFDLDGTLADTVPDITAAANYACRKLGLPEHAPQAIPGMIGSGERRFIERALGPGHRHLVEEGLRLYLDYYSRHCADETRLYPGVKETLARLAGKSLAVLSNKRLPLTEQVLRALGIFPWFRAVRGGGQAVELKPSPQQLLSVLAQLGVPAGRAVMVGDKLADIQTGKAAGTFTVAVTYGYGEEAGLREARPDFLIAHLLELTALVV